jgi:hypothetical protein
MVVCFLLTKERMTIRWTMILKNQRWLWDEEKLKNVRSFELTTYRGRIGGNVFAGCAVANADPLAKSVEY